MKCAVSSNWVMTKSPGRFFFNNSSNSKEIFWQENKAEWSKALGLFLNYGLEDAVINGKWRSYCFNFVSPNNHLRIKGQWNATHLSWWWEKMICNIRNCPTRPVTQRAVRLDWYRHRILSMKLPSYFKTEKPIV